MTIQNSIAEDRKALLEAERKLAEDAAQLAKDREALEAAQARVDANNKAIQAIQPQMQLLSSIESSLVMVQATASPSVAASIEPLRLVIVAHVDKIRNLIIS